MSARNQTISSFLDPTPLPTDKMFKTSPDSGHPDCICSRCGTLIDEEDMPIRIFVQQEDVPIGEFRYHTKCLLKSQT